MRSLDTRTDPDRDRRTARGRRLPARILAVFLATTLGIAVGLAAPVEAAAGEKVAAFLDSSSSSLGGSASTALGILKGELAKAGLTVVETPDLGEVFPGAEAARGGIAARGAERVFVLSLMPLGEKWIVTLSERTGPALETAYSERMTASRVEEFDLVIPRLASAVLSRAPAPETAEVESVTDQEARVWGKKYGEFLWGMSIPVGVAIHPGGQFSYGIGMKFLYEMEAARIDFSIISQFNGGDEHLTYLNLAIEGYYLFSQRNISPYIGGGMGYAFTWINSEDVNDSTSGVVFNAGGGVEFFRLYHTRLMFDVKVGLPTYQLHQANESFWVPILTGTLTFVW